MAGLIVAPLPDGRLQAWMSGISRWQEAVDPDASWTDWSPFSVPSPLGDRYDELAVAPLSDGRLQLFAAVGSPAGFDIQTCWKETVSPDAAWTPWMSFPLDPPPHGLMTLAAAPLPDGRIQVVGLDGDGRTWSAWKADTDPDAAWTPWSTFGAPWAGGAATWGQLAMVPLSDQRLQVWRLLLKPFGSPAPGSPEAALESRCKLTPHPDALWSAWSSFPLPPMTRPGSAFPRRVGHPWTLAAGQDRLDRAHLFLLDQEGTLWWCRKETSIADAAWTPWTALRSIPWPSFDLGGGRDVAVAPLDDGRLQLFAHNPTPKQFTSRQEDFSADPPWSPWSPF